MTLKAQIEADNAIFFNENEFAVAAVYNSHDGTIVSASISVIIDLDADLGGTDFGAAEYASVWLKLSDVPRPAIYDKLTIGAREYTVRTRAAGAQGVVRVMCQADQRQNPVQ
jgi:hypothetical protein